MTARPPGPGPRTVPELLDAGLRLYLSRFGPLFGVALAAQVFNWLLGLTGRGASLPSAPFPGAQALRAVSVGAVSIAWWLQLAVLLVGLLADVALVLLAARAAGDPQAVLPSPGELARRTLGRVWPFFVVMLTLGLCGGIGVVLLVAPGILIFTWWAVAPVVAVVEERRAAASLGRSRGLVRGLFWHTFGAGLFALVVGGIVRLVLSGGTLLLAGVPGHLGLEVRTLWLAGAAALVVPYPWCVLVLLYHDLRARKEGADLLAADDAPDPVGVGP